jgi:hypothetical protein
MIELLFAVALATAVPLAFGRATEELTGFGCGRATRVAWVAVAPAVVALALPRGVLAGILVGPWLVAVGLLAIGTVQRLAMTLAAGRLRREPFVFGLALPVGFLGVGCGWLLLDRLAAEPFGFGHTLVLLTAVHFHVAGFVLTLAGVLAAQRRPVVGPRCPS